MAKWTKEFFEDALHKLYVRAATDKAFRARCVSDPTDALREITGDTPPADVKVEFIEKLPEKHGLLLPPFIGDRPFRPEELKNLGPLMAGCSSWNTIQGCKA